MERQASYFSRRPVKVRADAIALAADYFDRGDLFKDISRRVAVSTESGAAGARLAALRYLSDEVESHLKPLGFATRHLENRIAPGCPFLLAERIQDEALPTLLVYAHGDVAAAAYGSGKKPPMAFVKADRWYGPGVADSKAQHSVVLAALGHVIQACNGELDYNIKILVEMGEELGSPGLHELCLEQKDLLRADFMLACDGSRGARPTVVLGSRGHFSCALHLQGRREASRLTAMLAQTIRMLEDDAASEGGTLGPTGRGAESTTLRIGKIQELGGVGGACRIGLDYSFTQPGAAEQVFSRLPATLASLGFSDVELQATDILPIAPAMTDPDNVWARFVCRSLGTAGEEPVVLPCFEGVTVSDIFMTVLGLPTIWIPHAPPSCGRHGGAEYVSAPLMRQGLLLMTGLFWDLNACGAPLERTPNPNLVLLRF